MSSTTSSDGPAADKHRLRALFCFILLANAISWVIWLPLLASAMGWTDAQPSGYLHLLGGAGPMVAAFAAVRIYDGSRGTKAMSKRVVLWRVSSRWHVIAWLAPVALYLVGAVIVRVVWGAWPDLSRLGHTEEFPDLPLLVYWAANILFYGWGEEAGWRGFLLPLLQERMSALKATVLVTPVWAFWHLPLFFFVDGYVTMGAGEIAGWMFSILTGAVLMTWLFNSAGGSILIVAIFHGTIDIVSNSPSPGDIAFVVGALITIWGIWIVATNNWSDLAGKPRQTLRLIDS